MRVSPKVNVRDDSGKIADCTGIRYEVDND